MAIEPKAKMIIERYKTLKAKRVTWEDHWQDIADYFLPRTELEFGRESTPRAHRLYKVIDLTQKHTRSYCSFS